MARRQGRRALACLGGAQGVSFDACPGIIEGSMGTSGEPVGREIAPSAHSMDARQGWMVFRPERLVARPDDPDLSEIVGLDHVQLGMPAGGEDRARAFYGGVLGLSEVAKPAALAGRGGCWFAGPGVAVHLGVEPDFRPATKAHPAFLVSDLALVRARLATAGATSEDDEGGLSVRRCYLHDPFGNRIELVDARDAGFSAGPLSPWIGGT